MTGDFKVFGWSSSSGKEEQQHGEDNNLHLRRATAGRAAVAGTNDGASERMDPSSAPIGGVVGGVAALHDDSARRSIERDARSSDATGPATAAEEDNAAVPVPHPPPLPRRGIINKNEPPTTKNRKGVAESA